MCFIGIGIWTACSFLWKRLVRMRKKWKRKKEQAAQAVERRKEYQKRQQAVQDIIARLWEDELFTSMMPGPYMNKTYCVKYVKC